MKKTTNRALLFALTSFVLLTGCSKEKEVVTIGEKVYVKEKDSYTEIISNESKVFLPGEHIIYYNVNMKNLNKENSYRFNRENGWGNIIVNIPEVPEGYSYVNTFSIDQAGYGTTSNIIHVFVNNETVEAKMTYNEETEMVGYFEPGVPVKSLKLE